jgi:phosphoribosylglycinamide formyltransferase-1
MARLKAAALISGGGTNLQALIDAAASPGHPAELALVLSNRADAFGLERARNAGIAAEVIDHRGFPDRASFDAALDRRLRMAGIELICLAGFMRLLTPGFVEAWRDRMINIHPSLLPAVKGLHTHERVIAAGCRFTGCTVHFVRPEMDDGPIIVQAAVPVLPDDTPERLAARVLAEEHRIYPLGLRLVAEGRVRVVGERAIVENAVGPATALINPAGAVLRRDGEIALRPLVAADAAALLDMVLAFHAEDGHPLSAGAEAAIRQLCAGDPLARGWFVELAGRIVGYAVLTLGFSVEYLGRDAFIDDLYLVTDVRGRGVGGRVMTLLEAEARAQGVRALHLEVDPDNARCLALYRRLGFAETGRRLMFKRLDAS